MKYFDHLMCKPWRNGAVCAVLAAVVAACTPTVPPKPVLPPVPAKPPPPVVALARPTPSVLYRSINDYKQALARHILSRNVSDVAAGDLQPLLRAVVVLSFQVDRSGAVRNIRTLRTPESAAERIARTSLQRAGAVPAPNEGMLQGGVLDVTETWLFNSDGKFSLRTLGPRQRRK